jgi:hypothetical protein
MRTISFISMAVTALAGAALLAGCSTHESLGSPAALPLTRTTNAQAATGVARQFLENLHLGYASPRTTARARPPAALAVTDFGTGAVEVLNKAYRLASTITDGVSTPDGDFYDANRNLYVANAMGGDVTEYNAKQKLIFTYSSGLTDVVDVTVDKNGNVYAVDFGDNSPSRVAEYPPNSTVPAAVCSTELANDGVVVDPSGDVFISGFNVQTMQGNIVEYKHGLMGCRRTKLHLAFQTAGGLAMDAHLNLLACDQDSGINIIPPPYKAIASTISSLCFHESLNKGQNLIFIAQPNTNTVVVDTYPAGTTIATLGSTNGLTEPAGVAAFP